MRHKVSGRRLSRDMGHRNALRRNLVADLLAHGKVETTEAKARMLQPTAERVITLAKRGISKGTASPAAVHARRIVATRVARTRVIEDSEGKREELDVLVKLFNEIAPRYANRPGGYTRLVKLGRRAGDSAEMAVLMFVEGEA